jgi:hypothetical protein
VTNEATLTPSCLITNGEGNNTTTPSPTKGTPLHYIITYYVGNNCNNGVVSSNGVVGVLSTENVCSGESLCWQPRNNGMSEVISNTLSAYPSFSGVTLEVRGS